MYAAVPDPSAGEGRVGYARLSLDSLKLPFPSSFASNTPFTWTCKSGVKPGYKSGVNSALQ